MTQAEEIAWAAGLYEGEGCAMVVTVTGFRVARMSLCSTDLDVLHRFRRVMKEGTITGPERRGTNKPIWRWQVQEAAGVIRCLRMLRPYLGVRRRAQADAALDVAWRVVGRKVLRHAKTTLFGLRLSRQAAATLTRALGEE